MKTTEYEDTTQWRDDIEYYAEQLTIADEKKINAITDILLRYCEPRPEISGCMAKDVAKKILTAISC